MHIFRQCVPSNGHAVGLPGVYSLPVQAAVVPVQAERHARLTLLCFLLAVLVDVQLALIHHPVGVAGAPT